MIYVLKINDEVISVLKENELQYKNLKLSFHKGLCDCSFYAEVKNKTTVLHPLPENHEIKFLCYHEEKNTTCCLEAHIFYQINAIIDEYKYITLDDFSMVNY